MKIKVIISLIVASIIIIFALTSCFNTSPTETISDAASTPNSEIENTNTKNQESKETEETETTAKDNTPDLIKVTKPEPNQVIYSPLAIEGEARGNWFFEATFPIKLLDADGNIITTHYAQAEGEWMTEDFVPFKAQIEFEKPATDTGVLILERDNPSGLPENDAKVEIVVRFY